jgi:translation initiation factor 6 (eIF-6)
VGICAVANSRGALLGELSSGFEVQRAYQALSGE